MSEQGLREIKCPSGAVLKVQSAPFVDAKALYQAVFEEMKGLNLNPGVEIDTNLIKDLFCVGLASKKIEAAIWTCMSRATYGGAKITQDTFEPISAREDYLTVCFEVAKENINPFMKSLYAQFGEAFGVIKNFLS